MKNKNIRPVTSEEFGDTLPSIGATTLETFNKKLKDSSDKQIINLYDELVQDFVVNTTSKSGFLDTFKVFKKGCILLGLYGSSEMMMRERSALRDKEREEWEKKAQAPLKAEEHIVVAKAPVLSEIKELPNCELKDAEEDLSSIRKQIRSKMEDLYLQIEILKEKFNTLQEADELAKTKPELVKTLINFN